MPNNDEANPHVFCRDCGQLMKVIQQPTFDARYIPLVTCWNRLCRLHGVTLSVDQYETLTEEQLEAYREMNRSSRRKYIKRR
jgi:hypothetical protein